MIKKIVIIIIAVGLLILVGVFGYFRAFQNLPDFAVSLLSEMNLPAVGQKVLIIAPHTDDEVLGAGGFIASSIKNGAAVTVVITTNGDGHRFSSMEEFRKLYPSAQDYIQSGYSRQKESQKALAILGVDEKNIIFLGYPDLGLKNLLGKNWQKSYRSSYTKSNASPYNNSFHRDVSYTGENLTADLAQILKQITPDIIIVSSPDDIHPDHAAASAFLDRALEKNGLKQPPIYYYLIHYHHFPSPKGYHPSRLLSPPTRLIKLSNNWQKFMLDEETLTLKSKALRQYQSQLKVPFLHSLMDSFLRQNELFEKKN